MNSFYLYLKQSAVISLVALLVTGCATTDYVNEKPDDFTTDKTLPDVSFPEEEGKTTEPPVSSPPPVKEVEPPEENKGKFPVYIVQQGDTLYSIAHRYSRSIEELATWNNLESPYSLSVGQKLIISSPVAAVDTGSSDTYEVIKGDTLFTIAKKYGRTTEELATWNNLESPYNLSIGQKLIINPPTGTVAKESFDTHAVVKGDTLFTIAKKYGRTTEELATWNNLESPYLLTIGQVLRVSPKKP